LVLDELANLVRSGLEDSEADFARDYAASRAALDLRDPALQIRSAAAARLLGLPPGLPESLPEAIARLSRQELRSAVAVLAAPEDLVIAVVASATPALQAELAGIPGVKDVAIVGHVGP
jgi:predicted Zn-dependent peptidase